MSKKTIEQIEAHLKRLRSRLKRTVNAIDKWERQKARQLAKPKESKPPKDFRPFVKPVAQSKEAEVAKPKPIPPETAKELQAANRELSKALIGIDPLDVRSMPWNSQRNEADEKAKAEILAEQSAKKEAKTKGGMARRKADRTGERRTMPLTGKAALAKIKED